MDLPEYNWLGFKFFGQRVGIEKTDNPQVDEDLKALFIDCHIRKHPVTMSRRDIQRVFDWRKQVKAEIGVPTKEARQGQKSLFEEPS